jgi:hypothetical protein
MAWNWDSINSVFGTVEKGIDVINKGAQTYQQISGGGAPAPSSPNLYNTGSGYTPSQPTPIWVYVLGGLAVLFLVAGKKLKKLF